MTELNIASNYLGEDLDDKPDMSGVVAISNAIPTMGAMTSLHIGNNNIPVENMNEIIALVEAKPTMKLLCAVPFRDKTITELDVSGQSLGVEGAVVIRRYLENNGALVTVTINKFALPIQDIKTKTELNFSGKELQVEDAIIIAALIPLNVSPNVDNILI
jgi:hypothetical protein